MLKKIIVGLMLFATVSFGMSLAKLNGASKADLMEINGIGEVKAAALIKERRKGKFKSFADLQDRVEGIGEQTTANIKGDVKNASDVKKVVKKKTKSTTKKRKTTKADNKKEEIKAKTKRKTKVKSKSNKKPAKVKKADDKKKVLKKKPRKTKTKKTNTKKTKTKTKKKKAKN